MNTSLGSRVEGRSPQGPSGAGKANATASSGKEFAQAPTQGAARDDDKAGQTSLTNAVHEKGASSGAARSQRTGSDIGLAYPERAPGHLPDHIEAGHLTSRNVFQGPDLVKPEPFSTTPRPAYVLPNGGWWLALVAGVGNTSGRWYGPEGLSAALNNDETFGRLAGGGVVVGRHWYNGLSLGIGLGMAQQRSRSLHTESAHPNTSVALDTNWTPTPMGTFTWQLDSFMVELPSSSVRYSTTNSYTLLRIPVEAGWRHGWRRWMFGLRGGVIFNKCLSAKGQSLDLESGSDPMPSLFDLAERPTIWEWGLSGFAGISAGFQLTDALSVWLGPEYQRGELLTRDEVQLSAGHWGLQGRLEFAFHRQMKRSRTDP